MARIRQNGGFVGKINNTTTSGASGIFGPNELQYRRLGGLWPNVTATAAAQIPDEYFEYTTLLLPGNGTIGAHNNAFLDSSTANGGSGWDITRNGNPTQGTFSPFSQTGWGNYFNGTNAYLSTPSITIGTGDFTVEAWQYILPDGTDYGRVVGIGDFQTSSGLGINFNPSTLKFEITTGNSSIITSSSTFSYNTWYHISLVRSGNTVTLYVNGTSQGSVVNTNSISGVVYISAVNYLSTIYYGASYTSNVRITTTAIVPPAGGPTAPLTAVTGTLLLTCQSNRFIDTNTQVAAKTITRNGSPAVVAFSPFNPTASWSAATNGGSGYFDGSGDYLTGASTSGELGAGDFTVEAWVYSVSRITTQPCIFSNVSVFTTGSFTIFAGHASSSTTKYQVAINGIFPAIQSTSDIVYNAWTHVAVVRNGSGSNNVTLYINGVANGTATSTATLNGTSGTCWIGASGDNISNTTLNGYISGVRIVKGTAVYTAAFTPPTAPLTAITNTSLLLNFTNAGIYDATSKNDLETVGNAQISTAISAKWGSGSIKFDGTGDYLNTRSTWAISGSEAYTLEAWIYPTTVSGDLCIYETRSNSGSIPTDTGFVLFINSTGKLQVYDSTGLLQTASTTTLTANTWTYIAMVRSAGSSTNTYYVNGTSAGTFTLASFAAATNARIGARNDGIAAYNGYMQDFRITKGYARTITASPTAAFPTL